MKRKFLSTILALAMITSVAAGCGNNAESSNTGSSNAGSRIGESKNECCDLCLQDINDKFVLSCGDFYCRDCITGVIKACLNDISKFDKMVCPKEICGEPGLPCMGCLSKKDLDTFGINLEKEIKTGLQRPTCACLGIKHELLNRKSPCIHNCMYCYWKD